MMHRLILMIHNLCNISLHSKITYGDTLHRPRMKKMVKVNVALLESTRGRNTTNLLVTGEEILSTFSSAAFYSATVLHSSVVCSYQFLSIGLRYTAQFSSRF